MPAGADRGHGRVVSADEGRVGAAMLHGRKRYADELTAGTLPRLYGASWIHDPHRPDDTARRNERGAGRRARLRAVGRARGTALLPRSSS